jgi:hypothetical protein
MWLIAQRVESLSFSRIKARWERFKVLVNRPKTAGLQIFYALFAGKSSPALPPRLMMKFQ